MSFNGNKPDFRKNRNVKLFQVGYVFAHHNDKDVICKTCILVDTCFTDSFRNNRDIFMNVPA